MLTLRQYIAEQALILEDRIEKIKDIYKDKIDTSHDSNAEHKHSDAIVDHFASKADPTPQKEYTHWITGRYKKGNFRQEDHPRIHKALSDFHTHKNKLPVKDINQYKQLSDVEDAAEPHLGTAVSKKEEKKAVKQEGADLVHDDTKRGVTVHHIKTEKAACAYGAGTKWCTAGKEDNRFNHYNKQGPLFVIQHKGRKYQLHNESRQLMDEKDHPTKFEELHPDIQKSMAEVDHPAIQKANLLHGNPHISEHHLTKALDSKDDNVRTSAIAHPKATPEHITKALDDQNTTVRRLAISHPNATPDHITKALDDESDTVRRSAIAHRNATPEHITKALNDKVDGIRRGAVGHPNATPEHITKALDDKVNNVRLEAVLHPKATPDHITKALDDQNTLVRRSAIKHPNATPNHITKALDDRDADNRRWAILHPKATPEHISKAMDDVNHDVRREAVKHPKATSSHIHKALDDNNSNVRELAVSHPNVKQEHINKGLNDIYHGVRSIAKESKNKITEEAPVNNVGGGNIAGLGVGSQGEPPAAKTKSKYKRQNEKDTMLRRPALQMTKGKFGKYETFIVPRNVFERARLQKRHRGHWSKYLDEDNDIVLAIREYANKNPGKAVVLQDASTGYMMFSRYGSKK